MNQIEVGPVSRAIAAPPGLVFQMLSAIGQGTQRDGERAEILERRDGEMICDFWTTVSMPVGRDRLVKTRERVRVLPPDRVDYEHLDGPVHGLRESIIVSASKDGGATITYSGTYQPRGLLDRLRAIILARPTIERIMRAHLADLGERAESRAARSRIFAPDPGSS